MPGARDPVVAKAGNALALQEEEGRVCLTGNRRCKGLGLEATEKRSVWLEYRQQELKWRGHMGPLEAMVRTNDLPQSLEE